jgi:hypothetical protein
MTYAGTIYRRQDLRPIFRALKHLADAGDIDLGRVHIDLFGDCETIQGRPIRAIAAELGLDRCITIEGAILKPHALRRIEASHLLILLAEGLSLRIPAKTYDYLRSGRPILALTSEGALADLLRTTGGAWIAEPTDEAAIVAAIHEAYTAWTEGRNSIRADPQRVAALDRRLLAGQFARLLDNGTVATDPATQG